MPRNVPPKTPRDEPARPEPKTRRQRLSSLRITIEQYNKMFQAYLEKPNLSHAAKSAGVNIHTAKYYVDGPARPEAGLEPIKARCARVHAAAQEAEELTLMRFRQEQIAQYVEIMKTSDLEMALHRKKMLARAAAVARGEEAEPGSTFATAVSTRSTVSRDMERFLGGPDATMEHRGMDVMSELTFEEGQIYATTGVLPERVRLFSAAIDSLKSPKGGPRQPQ